MEEFVRILQPSVDKLVEEAVLKVFAKFAPREHTRPKLVPKDEAQEVLHTSDVTLWRWEKKGYLIPVRIGGKIFYKTEDIDALQENKRR